MPNAEQNFFADSKTELVAFFTRSTIGRLTSKTQGPAPYHWLGRSNFREKKFSKTFFQASCKINS